MDVIYSRITDDSEFGIEVDKHEKSDIQEFFAGEIVFLTGCTGFLGKCFVEKLLRSCPDLKKLYLMMRPRKVPSSERAKRYFHHVICSKLRSLGPNVEDKVVFIEGNLMMENLGISSNERSLITNDATMIIHNASNVKFDGEIKEILTANVYGTLHALNLAKDCNNLKIFTYVSTAYSHSYQQHIEEKCYPPPGDLRFIQDFIHADESCPGALTEARRYEAVKPWPNLYTFSKAAAESLIEKTAKDVPFRCLIFQPAIVLSTYEEPIPAWCGNVNGPVAAVIGAGTGVIRALRGGRHPLDLIPADKCTNALLAIMWDSVVNRTKADVPPQSYISFQYFRPEKNAALVYNYGSSTVQQMNLFQLQDKTLPRGYELPPSRRCIRPYYLTRTSCPYWYSVLHIFLHWTAAILGDIAIVCALRRKPKFIMIAVRLTQQLERIWVFVNGNWRIHIHETRKMWGQMSNVDKKLFDNDLRNLDWADYGYNYWAGIRQWILEEPNDEGDLRYLKTFSILTKLYWISMKILSISFIAIPLDYFSNWTLLLLTPFINLAKLISYTL